MKRKVQPATSDQSPDGILAHIDAPVPGGAILLDWEQVVLASMEWPVPTFGGLIGAQQAAADAIAGKIVRGRPMLCARCGGVVYVAHWSDNGCVCTECYGGNHAKVSN